ncbi:hypothetical protein A8C32_18135 [Flavivirga aquatica]|uniref:Conjugative transposon protein TraN n=1 Tax=Flavivirga aquatica TaxID=1849968 RepID=A0A1E5T7M9_9FLAO|nr:DUF4138 domain-containing protein [Flavivirga aquatica]OEK07356.1 hypothetical protein A8C32_18135 [Flavivirga aquatica]
MKKQIILSIALAFIINKKAISQKHLIPLEKQDTLQVSDIKTTHLLFDQRIKYLDVGSPYFVADTTQQMVKLKHIGEELVDVRSQVSNLTVITEDGGYYSLVLSYKRFLDNLTYKVKRTVEFADAVKNEVEKEEEKSAELLSLCEKLDKNFNNKIHIKNGKSGDIRIRVTGIFYIKEKIGLRLELKNESAIDFDIDNILFRTKLNKRLSKDYLYQERVIHPIHTCTEDFEIIGNGQKNVTLLFDKFMLNEKEKLSIDIFETNGGRSASINIAREDLLKPKVI